MADHGDELVLGSVKLLELLVDPSQLLVAKGEGFLCQLLFGDVSDDRDDADHLSLLYDRDLACFRHEGPLSDLNLLLCHQDLPPIEYPLVLIEDLLRQERESLEDSDADGIDLIRCDRLNKEKDLRGTLIEIENRKEKLVISLEGQDK